MPGMPKVSFYGSPNLEHKTRKSIGEIGLEKSEELHYATPKRKKLLKKLSTTCSSNSSMILMGDGAQANLSRVNSKENLGINEKKDNETSKDERILIDEDDVPIFQRFVKDSNNDSDIKKPKRQYVKKIKKEYNSLHVRKSPRTRRSLNLQFIQGVQNDNNEDSYKVEMVKENTIKQNDFCVLSISSQVISNKEDINSQKMTLNKKDILDSDESIENNMNYANYAINNAKQLTKETEGNKNELMNETTFKEHINENTENVKELNVLKIKTVSTESMNLNSSNAKVICPGSVVPITTICSSIENSNAVETHTSKSLLPSEASKSFTVQCKTISIEVTRVNIINESQSTLVDKISDISQSCQSSITTQISVQSSSIQPPSTPTQPPSTPTQPPSSSTQPPSTPTQPPSTPTQPPSTSIQTPSTPTQPPSTPTQPPSTSIQTPSTLNQPPSTSNQPQSTPNQPPSTPTQPSTPVSILRKRKLQTFPKDTPPSKKVAFNERIQTREIPSRKDVSVSWKHNSLLFNDFIINDTSITDASNDDNSIKEKISTCDVDVKSTSNSNDSVNKDVDSNDFMAVYPSLADCKVPIDDIIHHLTASPWIRGLKQLMKSQGITSIGDLASSKICDINQLPLPNPKIPRLLKVLDNWVTESKELHNKSLIEEDFSDIETERNIKTEKSDQVIEEIVKGFGKNKCVPNEDVKKPETDDVHLQEKVSDSLKEALNSDINCTNTPLVMTQKEDSESKNDDSESDSSNHNFTKIIENKIDILNNCNNTIDQQRIQDDVEEMGGNGQDENILHDSLELNQVDAADSKLETVLDKLTELKEYLNLVKEDCEEKNSHRDMKKEDLMRVMTGFNDLQNLLHQIVLKFI